MALATLIIGFVVGALICVAALVAGAGFISALALFSASGTAVTVFAMFRKAACMDHHRSA